MPEPITPVTPAVTPKASELPKTKEEWDKLWSDNPQQWKELTQQRQDTFVRESREEKEKRLAAEQRESNLKAELDKYKQAPLPVQPQPVVTEYGTGNYPKTEDEWNDLFIERPAFATDLRAAQRNENKVQQDNFVRSWQDSQKIVQKEHPDMYVFELDDSGNLRKDGQGNPILKLNPVDKEPMLNPNSEKGKLWIEIINEDVNGWTALRNAPTAVMAEMERRLKSRGKTMINGQNNSENDDSNGVAPRGVTPPVISSVKFASEEERAKAQLAVNRGTYKSLEEYQKWHTMESRGFAESNSRPDFTKK